LDKLAEHLEILAEKADGLVAWLPGCEEGVDLFLGDRKSALVSRVGDQFELLL